MRPNTSTAALCLGLVLACLALAAWHGRRAQADPAEGKRTGLRPSHLAAFVPMPGFAADGAVFRGPAYKPDGTFVTPYTNRNPAPVDVQAPVRSEGTSLNMGLGKWFGNGQVRREYVGGALKYEDVVDELTAFIPEFARREPNWDLFANDFKLVDHRDKEQKLRKFVLMWALLSSLRSKLTLKSSVESLNVVDGRELPGISTKIYASVKMTIDGVAPRFYHRFRKRREDILGAIEAEVVFSLNDKNEVSELHIEDFMFDHESVESWPDIDLTGAPASAVDMREWALPRVSKIVQWIHDRRGVKETTGAVDVPGIEKSVDASKEAGKEGGKGMGGIGSVGSTPPPLAMA